MIWVLFAFMILLLVPIQVFTPLKPPYQEADTWAQIIATLMVALAFDASLNTSWLIPTRNRQEAIDRKERIGAFTMVLLVVIAAGLLVTMYMTG